jgi:polysaccharide export outer membrane protein
MGLMLFGPSEYNPEVICPMIPRNLLFHAFRSGPPCRLALVPFLSAGLWLCASGLNGRAQDSGATAANSSQASSSSADSVPVVQPVSLSDPGSTSPAASPSESSSEPASPSESSSEQASSPDPAPQTTSNYHIRPNDLIHITVFQEDDLTVETRVPENGSIMFPLLGSVSLQGKTVAEAQEQIRSLLAKKYIINPHVTVAVLDYSKLWVTVLGEVKSPGKISIPAESGLDLLGAIASASGYTADADAEHVNIRRSLNGQDTMIVVNATQLAQNSSVKPFMLEPGDTITVKYAKEWVTVLGQVQRPGKVRIPPEGDLDLLGAVALAGGFAPSADLAHIAVRRNVNGSAVVMNVNAKELSRDSKVEAFLVQPGDSLMIPERMF